MQPEEQQLRAVYEQLGPEGMRALVAGFYAQIPTDPILAPMYPADDLAGAEQRLRDFLIFRLGGPDDYIQQRGHPRLRGRHRPFKIDRAARNRWILLMNNACDGVELPANQRAALMHFLGRVASFLINHGPA